MKPDPEKPWTDWYDVVDDLVGPALAETRELVQKCLDEAGKELRSLKSTQQHFTDSLSVASKEQRVLTERLATVPQNQRMLAEQLTSLGAELQSVAGAMTGMRHEQRQLGADLAARLERLDILRAAVDAEFMIAQEVRDGVADIRRRQVTDGERLAEVERLVTDPGRAGDDRDRPMRILGLVSGATLALVLADLVMRLL
jgi:hypothetical protein